MPRLFITGMDMGQYGLFVTLSLFSTYGVLSMMDFGMGGAVTTFVAKYHHTDCEKLRRLWTFSVFYFTGAAILATAAGGYIVYFHDPGIVSRIDSLGVDSHIIIPTILMTTLTFLSYLGETFLYGFNDYKFTKQVTILQSLLRLALIYLVISTTQDLFVIIWLMAALSFMRLVAIMTNLLLRYREFTVFRRIRLSEVKEWLHYSLVLLAGSLTGFIFNSMNRILIMLFLPVRAMGDFDVASKPQTLLKGILSALISAIIPLSAHYTAAGRQEKIRELFFRGTFWLNILLLPPLAYIMVMMPELISVWLGPGHAGISTYALLIISYFLFFAMPASLANLILIGAGEAKRYIPVQIGAGFFALIFGVTGVLTMGLKGVVLAFLIGQIIANIGCLWVFFSHFGLSLYKHIIPFMLSYLKLLIPPFAIAWGARNIDPPLNIFGLTAGLISCCAAGFGVYYLFFMRREEKDFLFAGLAALRKKQKIFRLARPQDPDAR